MQPFEIAVPDADLRDLRDRLERTRFPDQIPGAGWRYGTELEYLKELCAYWREKYDWREHERRLNALDHFRTEIEGLGLHFVHARSRHAGALPLLITHGWPGSIFEFTKIIPRLTDPEAHGGRAEDAFHVVCPSLPGYAWSDPPREPGWDPRRVARLEAALMTELGYARYGAQGGDWGAIITAWLGALDASHLAGIHLNMVVAAPPSGAASAVEGVPPEELAWLEQGRRFRDEETGYQQIQGTRPQSLGYGLNDSPAGLAAWIVEKFRAWSDCGGDVERSFSKDELLTNVMIYWTTQSIASSTRIYYEMRHAGAGAVPPDRIEVPTGVAVFPGEIYKAPRKWVEARYDLKHWSVMPRGGHFAALEEPELLAGELREFFRPLR